MVIRGVIALALLAVLIYGGIEAFPLIVGPQLAITSPVNGTTTPGGLVTVSGVATHTESLTLNGATLLIDEKGRFLRELLFPRGVGILTFTARDRFGRTITVERSVFVP